MLASSADDFAAGKTRTILRRIWGWGMLLGMVGLGGCGTPRMHAQVPEAAQDRAVIAGMPATIRTWGDQMSPGFVAEMVKSREQMLAYLKVHPEETPATVDMLALSGGGENGAFGAGLLYGWTQAGNRPKFRLVTGISTGALIAPFAFVGPDCDEKLKAAYTTVAAKDIFIAKDLLQIPRSDSLTDVTPLIALIDKWVDADVLREIAEEHAKGRRLFIATVNLDAQRQVIWDMGAIASSKDPGALKLFRQVMLASASIPMVFPPVYFNVMADGKAYDEMHVDGGAISQVFLWDAGMSMAAMERQVGVGPIAPVRVFVIRNAYLLPEWQEMRAELKSIAPRATATLIKSQGIGDLYRLYATCQRDGFDFNVAHIPNDFTQKLKEPFDTVYMNSLFEVGYKMGKEGYVWIKTPFSLTSSPATAPAK